MLIEWGLALPFFRSSQSLLSTFFSRVLSLPFTATVPHQLNFLSSTNFNVDCIANSDVILNFHLSFDTHLE